MLAARWIVFSFPNMKQLNKAYLASTVREAYIFVFDQQIDILKQ